jgi:hypothetical protein
MHRRSPSPFIFFCASNNKIIDEKYPKITFVQKSKKLFEMWNNLSIDEKLIVTNDFNRQK